MKTCKKILVAILVFAIMMSMCAFVSAEETTETETRTTDILLWTNNFDGKTIGSILTSSWVADSCIGEKLTSFFAKSGSPSNKLATTTVAGDDTNKYITTTHNRLGYNPYNDNEQFKTWGYGEEFSVYSTSYDIMIPADDAYKANRRYSIVDIGSTAYKSGSTTTVDYTKRAVRAGANFVDGKIIGSATSSTTLYSKDIDYTYGEWVTVRIDGWLIDQKVYTAVYADDKLIYAGEQTSATTLGMAAHMTEFMYANIANGATLTAEAKTSGIESVTNYDNFKVSLLTADNELTAEEIAAQKEFDAIEGFAKTPQVTLHSYPADSLSSFIGGEGTPVFVDKGTLGRKDVYQNKATDDATKDAFVVVDKDYTNIISSSYKYLNVASYLSFSKYVQKDAKNTFVYSMDLNFKNFNAGMFNRFSLGIEGQKMNDIQGSFTVGTDGKISFSHSTANKGSVVEGKLKSESRTVPAGEWINVKMVFEINYGETQYAIKMFGIYEDAVIYENEFTLRHNEAADGHGISVDTFDFRIGKDNSTHAETVTSVQDIYFEKNNNFDWSEVDTDNWIERSVILELDASGNVDVEAKKGGFESFPSGSILLVALYDGNGMLIELLNSKTPVDGKFVYEVPAAKVATAKIIKAFVFDAITTAVPQIKHGEVMIGQ